MVRVLFVCLGNICRSPLAEGILRRQAQEAGVEIFIDSAGTGDWHTGELPDRRARAEGKRRGCSMDMRARQVRARDFDEFDLIVAMDRANVADLQVWTNAKPEKIRLARSYDLGSISDEVPDPYYGAHFDFEEVGQMIEAACRGILEEVASDPI